MKHLLTFLFFFAFNGFMLSQGLIISQYYEGTSSNKFIEITNTSDADIDLSGYHLCLFSNPASNNLTGVSPSSKEDLVGTLASGETKLYRYTATTSPENPAGNSTSTTACNFNGNDIIIISTSNGTDAWTNRTDVIGISGSYWGKDKSFYRNANVITPNAEYNPNEWTEASLNDVNNATSGTTQYLGSHTYNSPLPTSVVAFDVKRTESAIISQWTTLSEENNDYFAVEWSTDGIDFTELGKVNSLGDSREKVEYSYTHTNPVKGYNYYRLVQYDKGGRSEKFNVVSVLFEQKVDSKIYINPNIVYSNLKVEFSTPVANGRLHIYDTQGKLMNSYVLASGIDVFNFDVSSLPTGQYVVKYLDNDKMVSERFLKK